MVFARAWSGGIENELKSKLNKYKSAGIKNISYVYLVRTDSSGQVYNHQLQIRYRALDLLSEWIDGYYQFDFKTNPGLIKELLAFVKDEVTKVISF